MNDYFTILNEGKASFEEKKSVFIGNIARVSSEEEAKEYISSIKGKNKEARHNVYAYIIGDKMQIQRYSDDGEPQGTGGMPILEVIRKNNLKDCIIVVTRYFGGILLGTGGLTRAYTRSATMAIKETKVVQRVRGSRVCIEIPYDLIGKVQYFLAQNNMYVEATKYEEKVDIYLFVEVDKILSFKSSIIDLTSNDCILTIENEKYYLKQEERLYED